MMTKDLHPEAGSTQEAAARGPVVVELSRAQVDRIVRSAAVDERLSMFMSGLAEVRERLLADPTQIEDRRLSSSLMHGLLLLASFPDDGSYMSNTEVARLNAMNMSTAHRYISTLVAVGLLERDPATRLYRRAQ